MSDHALYSPSAATRWLTCPGSVSLSGTEVQGSSPAAEEGTAAHWLFENYRSRQYASHAPNGVELTEQLKTTVKSSLDVMNSHVSGSEFRELKMPTWKTLNLPEPIIWGTADVVALADDRAWLVDFKYGRYAVSPENNAQLLTYAVGLLDLVGDAYEDFSLAILQPRATHHWRQWDIKLQDIKEWADKLRNYFATPSDKIVPGGHCFFCPAKHNCPKRFFEEIK